MTLPPTKEIVKEVEAGTSGLFKLWLRVMRILEVQDKHAALIEKQAETIDRQAAEIATLRDAVRTLSGREDGLLARAGEMAAQAAAATVTDLARRLGHVGAHRSTKDG